MAETKEIVKTESNAPVFTQEQIELLKNTVAMDQNLTDNEFGLFMTIAKSSGLNPFTGQIYAVKRKSNEKVHVTYQTSVDGMRSIADRTGIYAGNDDYLFDEGVNEYQMIKTRRQKPITATATVYKAVGGQRCPFSATARWDEYFPGEKQGFMWRKMPFLMLGKCAEALALRKAFPAQMSGLYTGDEMQQADVKIEGTVEPPVHTSEQVPQEDVGPRKEALKKHMRGLLDEMYNPDEAESIKGMKWLEGDHPLDVLEQADKKLMKAYKDLISKQTPEVERDLNDDELPVHAPSELQGSLEGIGATQTEGNLTEG